MKLRSRCGLGVVLSLVLVGCSKEDLEGDNKPGYESQFDDSSRYDDPGADPSKYEEPWNDPNGCYDCFGDYRPQRLQLDLSSAVGLAIVNNANSTTTKRTNFELAQKTAAVTSFESGAQLSTATLIGASALSLEGGLAGPTRVVPNWVSVEEEGDGSAEVPVPPAGDEPGTVPTEEAGAESDAALYKLDEEGQMQPALLPLEEESPPDGEMDPSSEGQVPLLDENGEPLLDENGKPLFEQGEAAAAPPPPPPSHGESLPRVVAMGMSPDGSAYILFEHSFQYREIPPEDAEQDNWSPQSPYTCQLFHAPVDIDPNSPEFDPRAELECVTNQHEVPTWRQDQLMQFDRQGRMYFRATVHGGSNDLFYVYDPVADTLEEKVNGNICWHDVQVTPRGSVFYTGSGGGSGQCDGSSFFRYISADNKLIEIARDYYNPKYLAEQDPEDPESENIIFYGPDPRSNTVNGWGNSCLYRYDPTQPEVQDRVTELTSCSSSGQEYVYGTNYSYDTQNQTPEERTAFAQRCQEEGQVFIGGYEIKDLSQMADGTLFLAGSFERKVAGELQCEVVVNVSHCDNLDMAITDPAACTAAGGGWREVQPEGCDDSQYTNEFDCINNGRVWTYSNQQQYWDQRGSICAGGEGWTVNWLNCADTTNMGNYSESLSGLAYLDPKGDGGLKLLSDPGERVGSFWTINTDTGSEFYYSTSNAGTYSLQRAMIVNGEVVRQTVLTDFEIYNVSRDPANPGRILFDGLNFSRNEYQFGTVDPNLTTQQEIQDSLEVVQGVTGKIETLVIFPSF